MDSWVIATFLLVSGLEILIPFLLGYWIVRRGKVGWKLFGLGVLFFVVVQIVHTPLVVILQNPALTFLQGVTGDPTVALAGWAILLGLLAGLFEEVGRYLVFRYYFPRKSIPLRREEGFQFGVGWGGIESMLVGSLLLLTLFSYVTLTPLTDEQLEQWDDTLTSDQIEALKTQIHALRSLTPMDLLPGLAERLMAITLHLAWSLMVLTAIIRGRMFLLGLAVLWHTAVDAVAVFLAGTAGILAAEGAIALFALAGVLYLVLTWRGLERIQEPGEL